MQPIFKEYIQFLKDNGVDLPIEEGYYWLDNQIIKAYDNKGNLHKIARLKIDNKLNIICKPFPKENFEIEHWNDTVARNKIRLEERERKSLELVKEKLEKYSDYNPIILTSDGKDSTLVEHIVKQIISKVFLLFNNTSLECADTIKHVKKKGMK